MIAFPDYDEQERIADYIDAVVEAVNAIITNYEGQIELLHEMKHRIISDAITGRIDVRNVVIPEYEFMDENADDDTEDDVEEDAEEQED